IKTQEIPTDQSGQTHETIQQDQEPQKDQPLQKKGKVYKIQLGAFSSQGAAEKWKERLEKELKLKGLEVVESSGIFRVFYGSFGSRDEAERELERFWNLNIYGFIVYE
ncbi:MAG: SPOR domain-containing protein, partial [Aquificaceae bacterium]